MHREIVKSAADLGQFFYATYVSDGAWRIPRLQDIPLNKLHSS